MTDIKPPSAGALAFADWVLEFLVGYKTWAIEGNRSALAQRIDAFAERRAAEARSAILDQALQFACDAVDSQFDEAHYQQENEICAHQFHAALEDAWSELRALADKSAAGKGEP